VTCLERGCHATTGPKGAIQRSVLKETDCREDVTVAAINSTDDDDSTLAINLNGGCETTALVEGYEHPAVRPKPPIEGAIASVTGNSEHTAAGGSHRSYPHYPVLRIDREVESSRASFLELGDNEAGITERRVDAAVIEETDEAEECHTSANHIRSVSPRRQFAFVAKSKLATFPD
jgi:hypothetical protein